MTHRELTERMTEREFREWGALFEVEAIERERARKRRR
jgi:hypothetical protein